MFSDADGVNDECEGGAETEREREGSVERGVGLIIRQTFCLFKSNYGQPDVGSQAPTTSQCQLRSPSSSYTPAVSCVANSLKQNAANHAPNFGTVCACVCVGVHIVYIFRINVYKLCVFIRKIQ